MTFKIWLTTASGRSQWISCPLPSTVTNVPLLDSSAIAFWASNQIWLISG